LATALNTIPGGGEIQHRHHCPSYCIRNTSTLPLIPADPAIQTLYHVWQNSRSINGLGLAIVKKIIDLHGLNITYSFENDRHSFCIHKN
jgi:hypothetical protein